MLDIKWNPFIENIIASCSEDTSVSGEICLGLAPRILPLVSRRAHRGGAEMGTEKWANRAKSRQKPIGCHRRGG